MAEIDTDALARLAQSLTDTRRLQHGAALAGTGLVLPLAQLRHRSSRLELARIEARAGAKSPEAGEQRRLIGALAARATEVEQQHARRAGPWLEPDEGQAAVVGLITDGGTPAPGIGVFALDTKGEAAGHACTGRDGRYAMAVPADGELRFELRKGAKTVFRDRNGFAFPAGFQSARDIDFGDAEPLCDDNEPREEGSNGGTDGSNGGPVTAPPKEVVTVPNLEGLTRAAAEKILSKPRLKLEVIEGQDIRGSVVVAQRPPADSEVAPDTVVRVALGARRKTG